MKSKPNLFRLSAFVLTALFFVLPLRSQVMIGEQTSPQPYSILELSTVKSKGGFRLPQLTTAGRNLLAVSSSDALSFGLVIYNTDTDCVEYWNGAKWVSLCLGTANITLTGNCPTNPFDVIPADGVVSPPCVFVPSDDPPCAEGFQVYLTAGSNYAVLQVEEMTSAFSIQFSPNNSSKARMAVVRIVNRCSGEYKDFIFIQEGADCPTGLQAFTLSSNSTVICNGGAVIAWVVNPQAGVDYHWETGGVAVHTGTYLQITQPGKYTVYAGLFGCTTVTPREITVTQNGGSAGNAPFIYATNGGILCSGGNVILTAANVTGQVKWFHNGAPYSGTANPLTVSGAAMAGEWFAVQQDGSCGSRMSNIITLIDQTTSGTALATPVATVNGTALSGSITVCKSGTLELAVTNSGVYPPGTVYEWFDGSTSIYRGAEPAVIYNVSPAATTMTLSVQVSNTAAGCPNTAVSAPISVAMTSPAATSINNGAATAAICGSTPAVLSALNASGSEYQWFKDGVSIPGASAATFNAASSGSYCVRYRDSGGCWSLLSLPITVVQSAVITLSWQTEPPATATVGSTGSYTVQASPAATTYSWTSSPAGIVNITPIPPGYTASIDFVALGTTTVTVEATNACGTVSVNKAITVASGCAPVTNLSLDLSGTINYSLNANGTTKAGQASTVFTATPTPAGSPTAYEWYVNGTLQTGQTAATFTFNTPTPNAGVYQIYAAAVNACTPTNTVKSGTVTINVSKDAVPDVSGNYRLSGKTCYDVWETDYAAGNACMPKVARIDDFGTGGYVRNYNFFNTAAFTGLTYELDYPAGLITSFSSSGANNEILTVNFNSDASTGAKAMAKGRDKTTALKVTVTAKYKNNLNEDRQVSLEIFVQDCSCGCVLKKSATDYMTFMCYNLGAATAVQSKSANQQQQHSPAAETYGELFQWGRKDPVRTAAGTTTLSTVDVPAHGNFIATSASPYDWRNPQNNTLWNKGSEASPVKNPASDPCPPGWRVPTNTELSAVVNTSLNTRSAWQSSPVPGYLLRPAGTSENTLFLPAAGYRYYIGTLNNVGTSGYYWSSTVSGTNASFLSFYSGAFNMNSNNRGYGFSVRCISE